MTDSDRRKEVSSPSVSSTIPAKGEPLQRLAGHIAYWFAWQNFKPQAEVRVE